MPRGKRRPNNLPDKVYNLRNSAVRAEKHQKMAGKHQEMADVETRGAEPHVHTASSVGAVDARPSGGGALAAGTSGDGSIAAGPSSERDDLGKLIRELSLQLNYKLDSVKKDKQDIMKSVSCIEIAVQDNSSRISKIEKEKIPELQREIQKVRNEFEQKMIVVEMHERKQNLLMYGVQAKPNEVWKILPREK